jgi:hypothetical protein
MDAIQKNKKLEARVRELEETLTKIAEFAEAADEASKAGEERFELIAKAARKILIPNDGSLASNRGTGVIRYE